MCGSARCPELLRYPFQRTPVLETTFIERSENLESLAQGVGREQQHHQAQNRNADLSGRTGRHKSVRSKRVTAHWSSQGRPRLAQRRCPSARHDTTQNCAARASCRTASSKCRLRNRRSDGSFGGQWTRLLEGEASVGGPDQLPLFSESDASRTLDPTLSSSIFQRRQLARPRRFRR